MQTCAIKEDSRVSMHELMREAEEDIRVEAMPEDLSDVWAAYREAVEAAMQSMGDNQF